MSSNANDEPADTPPPIALEYRAPALDRAAGDPSLAIILRPFSRGVLLASLAIGVVSSMSHIEQLEPVGGLCAMVGLPIFLTVVGTGTVALCLRIRRSFSAQRRVARGRVACFLVGAAYTGAFMGTGALGHMLRQHTAPGAARLIMLLLWLVVLPHAAATAATTPTGRRERHWPNSQDAGPL